MEANKKLFKSLATSNSELANDIQQLARSMSPQSGEPSIAIKALLLRLYNSIVRLATRRGHPPAPNKTIVEAYHSFLEPIQALAELPAGDFLTARMFLYLSSAFVHDKSLNLRFNEAKAPAASAFLHEFCIDVDDGLLECLKRIWVKDNEEQFHWVFSECSVQCSAESDIDPARYPDLAQALSPKELAALGGKGRRWFWSEHTDEPVWTTFPARPPEVGDEDTEELLWKQIGTDGPIRESRVYRTLGKDACEESWHAVPVLRRSRQFIFDARQISKPFLTKERRHLLAGILLRAKIPTEIREMIWVYMKEPPPGKPSYLAGLDIAAAYAPFPRTSQPCQECKERKSRRQDKSLKETCPENTIYVWNLPLRLFHVLHQRDTTEWWLCKEGLECTGHHDDDDEWCVENHHQLLDWIDAVNVDRNDKFTELHDTDYGARGVITTSPKEDEARQDRLFTENGPFEDAAEQRKMTGGLCGPPSVMAHKAAVVGAWSEGRERGITTIDVQWALGRNLVEQGRAEDATGTLWHLTARYCWFCRGQPPFPQTQAAVRLQFPPLMDGSSDSDSDSDSD
ncbi:hypothetical protein ACHAPT_000570 [Fusarium lateritium]